MKKSAHGLELDKRKSRLNQLKDNGLDKVMRENRSEKSGYVKLKRSKIKKLERKAQEQLANGYYDQHEKTAQQIEKLNADIEKFLS